MNRGSLVICPPWGNGVSERRAEPVGDSQVAMEMEYEGVTWAVRRTVLSSGTGLTGATATEREREREREKERER